MGIWDLLFGRNDSASPKVAAVNAVNALNRFEGRWFPLCARGAPAVMHRSGTSTARRGNCGGGPRHRTEWGKWSRPRERPIAPVAPAES